MPLWRNEALWLFPVFPFEIPRPNVPFGTGGLVPCSLFDIPNKKPGTSGLFIWVANRVRTGDP
jgi:hypothetical protein